MTFLDPRLTPARADLAALSLRGQVEAARFVAPRARRVVSTRAPLRRAPDAGLPNDTEALFGEPVEVYDEAGGWAWAQLKRDGYVGYLSAADLGQPQEATHAVTALRSYVYPAPGIKTPAVLALPFGARLTVVGQEGAFVKLAGGGFVYASHVAPLPATQADFVAVAELFLHAPYLWGGRTSEGIDCSGLAQAALMASGVDAPRDTDLQEKALGRPLAADATLRRGDLVFWKGHIGLMRDETTLLHANGYHMKVVAEPLAETVERTRKRGGGEVTSIRRLDLSAR